MSGPEKDSPIQELISVQEKVASRLVSSRAATVAVRWRFGAGSGVIVSKDGLVLTAGHVSGEPGREVDILIDSGQEGADIRTVKGVTLGYSAFSDAGMIKIQEPGEYPYAPVAAFGQTESGDWCYALGHPGGFEESRPLVVRVGRVISQSSNTLRSDCKLLGGDSGGPLFNLQGEVIGIHSRISMAEDQNYHCPVDSFHRNWDEMLAGEEIRRRGAFLGVAMGEARQGVMVNRVIQESAASRAGLQAGDVITHIDDIMVVDPADLVMMIAGKTEDESVKISYQRGDEPLSVIVRLGVAPGWERTDAHDPFEELEDGE